MYFCYIARANKKEYTIKQLTRFITPFALLTFIACIDNKPPPAANFPLTPLATTAPRVSQSTNTPRAVKSTAAAVDFESHPLQLEGTDVAAADLNGDGRPDLVVGSEPDLTFYLNDGTGNFTLVGRAPGGQQPTGLAVADLDEDGHVDIAVANHDTDHLTLLLGDGSGQFQPAPNSPLQIDVLPHPHVVRALDLDKDGHVDLVIDNREREGLLILPGVGNGRFAQPGIQVGVGGDPYLGMAVGDIDGDGRPDLVTPNPADAAILLNRSKGTIMLQRAASVAAQEPFGVALGNFNDDGHLDLLTASGESSALVELFWGNGRGAFEPAPDSPFSLGRGGKNLAVGDFNGDGFDDAVAVSYQSPEVLILLGGSAAMTVSTLPGGEHPWGLAVADFDGDDRDDLIVVDDATQLAIFYKTQK